MDESVDAIVSWFLNVNLQERLSAAEAFIPTLRESQALLAYGERMATQTVRDGDGLRARAGLVATLLEGERYDTRETMIALAVLHDALAKVGERPREVYAEVAALAPSVSTSTLIHGLPQRPSQDLTPESMGMSAHGVKYEPDPAVWGS